MKALITGPRSPMGLYPDKELPYLSLETEFEELPKVGETIIINDGGSVVVKSIMWWVDGPADHPALYSFNGGTYDGEGTAKAVHITVEPEGWSRDLYAEGREKGRTEALEAFERALSLTEGLDGDGTRSVLAHWAESYPVKPA